MAWIKVVPEKEAEGELRAAYEKVKKTRGNLSNILMVDGLRPDVLETHLNLYLALMFRPSPLTRTQREMIATTVSSANRCHYCRTHHSEALGRVSKNPVLANEILRDYTQVNLSPKDRAMLDYAVELTQTPGEMCESDIQELRAKGWNDQEILDMTLITSYFNFVNRIALGLGVELEKGERIYKDEPWK